MREVVVTGVGLHVPGSQSAEDLFGQLSAGRSFIKFNKKLIALGVGNIASCAISDDEIATLDAVYPAVAPQLNPSGKMAYHALHSSLAQAGVDVGAAGERCGFFFGVHKTLLSPEQLFSMWQRYDIPGESLSPDVDTDVKERFQASQHLRPDHAVEVMVKSIGLQGPVFAYADACAAGSTNILSGFNRVRSGELDLAICGAADEGAQPLWHLVFKHVGALTTGSYEQAAEVCRPFDKDRSGCVLADGAAFLILEEAEHARARGAKILARISGGSRSSESHKITSSHADGRFYKISMEAALADAGLSADEVDHINAHGTATKSNDIAEGRAIEAVFGADIPVTATKSALGHSLSGSGAVEGVLSVLTLQKQYLLPTLNYVAPGDGEAKINVVTRGRAHQIRHILSNSFGFGGQNASLIFSRSE